MDTSNLYEPGRGWVSTSTTFDDENIIITRPIHWGESRPLPNGTWTFETTDNSESAQFIFKDLVLEDREWDKEENDNN